MDELIRLEHEGWQALSAGRDEAARFYARVLTDHAIMVFPGDMVVSGKGEILASFGAQPWSSFDIEDTITLELGDDAVALVYRATARRADSEPYVARITSVYVRQNEQWKLALHQQTPATMG